MGRKSAPAEASRLEKEIEELHGRLEHAEEELRAIREGEVDALLLHAGEEQVYTLERPAQPFHMLVDQINEGAATLTTEGSIICCNRRFGALLGRAPDELQGRHLRDFVAPESRRALDAMLA